MDRQVEIISMFERPRRCSNEQKLKILAEAPQPGATVFAVADRNGISRSQLYAWMKIAREGRMPRISAGSQTR
jgi:transposase-like protein